MSGPAQYAQANLLTMLSVAGDLPLSRRGLADLRTRRMPLLDALVRIFAEALLVELSRGSDRSYVEQEDDLGVVRGQILLPQHIRRNALRRHKVFCRFDEFSDDTWLNRALKAAVARLLVRCRDDRTRRSLKLAVEHFDEVAHVEVTSEQFDRISFQRNNERYRPLVNFARLVLLGSSPLPSSGGRESFSILFAMERLFERFVARVLLLRARTLGLDRSAVHPQGRGRPRWLLERLSDGRRVFRLRPDVVIDRHGDFPGLVLDTKWKRLSPDAKSASNDIAASDLYQMASYAQAYEFPSVMLLYPRVAGVTEKDFRLPTTQKLIMVKQLSLEYDLSAEPGRLDDDLRRLLWAGVELPATAA